MAASLGWYVWATWNIPEANMEVNVKNKNKNAGIQIISRTSCSFLLSQDKMTAYLILYNIS
jgi:hypothetical protein